MSQIRALDSQSCRQGAVKLPCPEIWRRIGGAGVMFSKGFVVMCANANLYALSAQRGPRNAGEVSV